MNPKAKVSKIDTSKVMDTHDRNEQTTPKVTPWPANWQFHSYKEIRHIQNSMCQLWCSRYATHNTWGDWKLPGPNPTTITHPLQGKKSCLYPEFGKKMRTLIMMILPLPIITKYHYNNVKQNTINGFKTLIRSHTLTQFMVR